jgi:hypothetical protein
MSSLLETTLLNGFGTLCIELAALQLQTDSVLTALYAGTKHIPYTIRCMAREMLLALQVKTQYQVEDIDLIPVIARGLILPYILPGIV